MSVWWKNVFLFLFRVADIFRNCCMKWRHVIFLLYIVTYLIISQVVHFACNFMQFSRILIPMSYSLYKHLMQFFENMMTSWYSVTFELTFPNVMILTWCVLGALEQMCRASFRGHRQSIISQSWWNHQCRNKQKHLLLNGSTTKPSNTLPVNWLKENTAFRTACHKSFGKGNSVWSIRCHEMLSK